ncbi:glycosyltransferase [Dokdonia sinensis]|uniref:Glycosyltransferase n=1 Tax=Dokdonia sinensis TaxID=2479847 RepID=A0A3M0G6L1_9FLAO|nr:glycosyltransferase family 4 protein [Dokdonia sinensis]RMB57403.1 glycosyltransferase [Dokdonia sinensis]
MKRKKLLYVGNALSHKGITVTTIDTLSTLLRSEGYDVVVTSNKRNKALRLLDMLWSVFQFRNRVDAVLIDTYSTTNYFYAVNVAQLCRTFHIPYFPILHGGNLPERLAKSTRSAQKLFGGARMNIAPSKYLYHAFVKAGFSNITHIPNTIEIDLYPFKERSIVAPKLLWVRSFAHIYNPKMALEVLEKLLKDFPEATLCMVGPEKDESYAECLAFAKAKKLPVTFTGKLSKKEWITLSAECDIFLNTTNFDNTPVSVIEAMALGLPIISTEVGGIPYLLENDSTAVLIPKGDVNACVAGIALMITQPEFAHRISLRARTVAEGFDWQTIKMKWNELLSFKI